jgi:formylglycine-generating enzyme required for sulfatase activity
VKIRIEDSAGSRLLLPERFPLSIGGAEADLVLPGVQSSEAVAWFGLSDGDLFIQSTDRGQTPVCNGAPVATSQWLHAGDEVRVGPARIVVSAQDGQTVLRIDRTDAASLTEPPRNVPVREVVAGGSDETTIEPVSFRPREIGTRGSKRWRLHPATPIVWAVIVLLGSLAWFLFSLRSVEVQIEPNPDRVVLEGPWPRLELGGRHLVRPGPYRLVAEKEGYRTLDEPIEVGDTSNQAFHFAMELRPDVLRISSVPAAGVRISIDGVPVGVMPLEPVELQSGEHEVRADADRHRPYSTTVSASGGGSSIDLSIAMEPLWADVAIRSDPPGAEVHLDREPVGVTPLTLQVLEGRHAYELRRSGYKSHVDTIEVTAGEARELPMVRLEPADAMLRVTSDPDGATVLVDGTYRGETPLELAAPPGVSLAVRLTKTGFETAEREVSLRSGQTSDLAVTLDPQLGEIVIQAEPPDAVLFINGKEQGSANRTVSLVAVPHRIEVRKEGYESFLATVTPRPGFPQTLQASLKTAEQLLAERWPPVVRSPLGHEMVLIHGGRMRMGASRREPGRRSNEVIREVELTRPYYLARTEVSNREFRRFHKAHLSGSVGAYSLENDAHPVVRISWDEAALFCNWLSEQEGLSKAYEQIGSSMVAIEPPTNGYRLPTEAEWAWAARYPDGQTAIKYPWGDSLPVAPGSGNYADTGSANLLSKTLNGYNDDYPVTAPVDSFEPNALGLFNLGGNVAEWVHDIYGVYGSGGSTVEVDPVGPDEGELHVVRGSSWMDASISELRLTFRDYGSDGRSDVGFRIARYAE